VRNAVGQRERARDARLLIADTPHLRSASSPARTSFPTGKLDRGPAVSDVTKSVVKQSDTCSI
jgi:hypothetical protein